MVYSTTNGTVAMTQARAQRGSIAARCSTRGGGRAHRRAAARETVLIVCSGSGNNFNFEDFYGAGCFVERFAERARAAGDFSDAAKAARMVYRHARRPKRCSTAASAA